MHSDLLKSRFVPNEDKSQWEPMQIITWLGVILNTIDGSIKATDERIATLSRDLENLSTGQNPTRAFTSSAWQALLDKSFLFLAA